MNLKSYLWLIALGTALAWLGWTLVILNIDPNEAGASGVILFYVTLFVSFVGTLALAGTLYRVRKPERRELASREVRISFRHAIMLSSVAIVSLLLASHGLLYWWNLLGLIALTGVIEYGFLLVGESRRD